MIKLIYKFLANALDKRSSRMSDEEFIRSLDGSHVSHFVIARAEQLDYHYIGSKFTYANLRQFEGGYSNFGSEGIDFDGIADISYLRDEKIFIIGEPEEFMLYEKAGSGSND